MLYIYSNYLTTKLWIQDPTFQDIFFGPRAGSKVKNPKWLKVGRGGEGTKCIYIYTYTHTHIALRTILRSFEAVTCSRQTLQKVFPRVGFVYHWNLKIFRIGEKCESREKHWKWSNTSEASRPSVLRVRPAQKTHPHPKPMLAILSGKYQTCVSFWWCSLVIVANKASNSNWDPEHLVNMPSLEPMWTGKHICNSSEP